MPKKLRLYTINPYAEGILDIGEIASRLASEFYQIIIDGLSLFGNESVLIWVDTGFDGKKFYVEHVVNISHENQTQPYDNKETGLRVWHAFLNERDIAFAIAGSILLSFERTFSLTIFGLPEEESWVIRSAMQDAINSHCHSYRGDGMLVGQFLLDHVKDQLSHELLAK